eukprot:TRINITY_DN16236_c0_g1_i1.p1 TRINITY_DN16236_c0_g1~~TRINITY_DN16236_c0_g1_i1.p1  ORF type:complete len:141 (+),score=12.16 TRINITY_DN16236_c0_g1_i1:376-798(+)
MHGYNASLGDFANRTVSQQGNMKYRRRMTKELESDSALMSLAKTTQCMEADQLGHVKDQKHKEDAEEKTYFKAATSLFLKDMTAMPYIKYKEKKQNSNDFSLKYCPLAGKVLKRYGIIQAKSCYSIKNSILKPAKILANL